MTKKYYYVRREIYEQNPMSKLNFNRSFPDMVRLFKRSLWVIIATILISIITMIILIIKHLTNIWILLPITSMIVAAIFGEIQREKNLYCESARKEELEKQNANYQKYVSDIESILEKHGIMGEQMIFQLKKECETALNLHKDKYEKIGNKIYDILIGVPLGALIASVIYAGNNIVSKSVFSIIFVGIITAYLIKVIQFVCFYTDGYFKDKYMLDVLNELNYSPNTYD